MTNVPLASNLATLPVRRPTRAEAEDAVRTLLAWAGDDPSRPGLLKTPERVTEAFGEYFSGYKADALAELATAFDEPHDYDDFVLLTDIAFESHCEHHIAPFFGLAHVAYIPDTRIAGLSKIARVVDIFARRLQTQETLTGEIATAILQGLGAKGVAVIMRARHHCMAARGVHQPGVMALTSRYLGEFATNANLRDRFVALTRERP